ncbi:MAG TPA: DUF6285 domain-containing protein [Burkholderiales bacterium]|nr:DUF6285 domain-containing protein [Burkholderiales bacterium]
MNNLPSGADLLSIARDTLLSELLPLASGEARYALLMVANAMAIAAREAEAGDAPVKSAVARLEKLYGETLSGDALESRLSEYERRLTQDIRAGVFDTHDDRQRALLAHLRESVLDRLRISNPKSFKSEKP